MDLRLIRFFFFLGRVGAQGRCGGGWGWGALKSFVSRVVANNAACVAGYAPQ